MEKIECNKSFNLWKGLSNHCFYHFTRFSSCHVIYIHFVSPYPCVQFRCNPQLPLFILTTLPFIKRKSYCSRFRLAVIPPLADNFTPELRSMSHTVFQLDKGGFL